MRAIALLAAVWTVAGGAAAAETVTVDSADCALLQRHRPAPDAAYRPGVDAAGRPVVPADLEAEAAALPAEIVIDLVQVLGEGSLLPGRLAGSEIAVGRLDIDPATGAAALNGRRLPEPAVSVLLDRCRSAFGN